MTTARDIVTRALSELRVVAAGETPSADDLAAGLDALNAMIAAWRTESIYITFPASTNWRGEWDTRVVYAVDDAVSRNGTCCTCTVAHTSSYYDMPIGSPNWASYWSLSSFTELAAGDTFPIPAQFERGVTAMLAVEIAPQFGTEPSPLTMRRASEGKTALFAAYMQITPARVDNGLIRMPSQIWPYNIDQIT